MIMPRKIRRRDYCVALIVAALEAHENSELREELISKLGCWSADTITLDQPLAIHRLTDHALIAKSALDAKCPGALGVLCQQCRYGQRVIKVVSES